MYNAIQYTAIHRYTLYNLYNIPLRASGTRALSVKSVSRAWAGWARARACDWAWACGLLWGEELL